MNGHLHLRDSTEEVSDERLGEIVREKIRSYARMGFDLRRIVGIELAKAGISVIGTSTGTDRRSRIPASSRSTRAPLFRDTSAHNA